MGMTLSKKFMEDSFLQYLEEIFRHPEITCARVRDTVIDRCSVQEAGRRAFEAGYHDCCSDIDLSVKVCLPDHGPVTPEEYMKRIDRFGVSAATVLGWMFVPEHPMYRIIFRNGMRYDLGFEFEYSESAVLSPEPPPAPEEENKNWPMEKINRFWFVQIQALGKLYRRDYLISSHLANMNCSETLVMQMVLRDLEHGTCHHRYGYAEALEYVRDLGKAPHKGNDPTFNRIADHLYAAAAAHDRLARQFYPGYRDRCGDFLAIWDCYESSGG